MKLKPMSDEERTEAVALLKAFSRPERVQGPRDWAVKLRFRELSGERLSVYQRDAWREALRNDPDFRAKDG